MKRIVTTVFSRCIIAALVCVSPMAIAQLTSARLSGSVLDPTGAAVPGAAITARNTGTNLTQTAQSSSTGQYSFNALPPGVYIVTTKKSGFATEVNSGVTLTVGQAATLDLNLKSGGAQEEVTVTGGAELINTTTAEISQVINEAQIKEIPINNRDPSNLVYLSAGVTNETISQAASTQPSQSFQSQTGASAGGGRQGSAWYVLDGVPNMDTTTLLAAPFPNSDATQEFRVITNNFDARYGFAPNAVVSILTKSGTNQVHGGVFEFIRNYSVNARQYFNGSSDNLRRNIFGGYVGGPVKKDKLFLFGNFQANWQKSTASQSSADTPTAAMLAGDFSAVPQTLHGYAGQPNPFSTVGGKPNQVNPAMFSKGALALIQAGIPLGQDPATGQLFYSNPATSTKYTEGTGRLDYNITDKQRAFLRVYADQLTQPGATTPGSILSGVQGQRGIYLNVAANHTWTISNTLLNSITAAYISYDLNTGTVLTSKSGSPICLSQFVSTVSDPPGECYLALSVFDGNGYYAGASEGFAAFNAPPYQTARRQWVLTDTVTKVLGRNTLAAGVDAYHRHYYEYNGYSVSPTPGFDGHYTGFILSDFLLGYATGIGQSTAETGATNQWMLGVYAQDQYKLRPNLTVNAGVRWDPNFTPSIVGNRGADFIPGAQSGRFPNAPQNLVYSGENGVPSGLFYNSYGYVQPRIGIAWQVHPKMAVRAGFGLFTTPMEDAFYNRVFDSQPFNPGYSSQPSAGTPFPFDNPWSADANTNFKNPFPPFPSSNFSPNSSAAFNTPVGLNAVFDPHLKLGVTQSWNFSIEQQFGASYALHLAYVGLQSYHQATTVDLNPGHYFGDPNNPAFANLNGTRTTYPNFNNVLQVQDGGTASYHSAQIGFERRMNKGLQFQTNFTWSKDMDVGGSGDPTFESSVSDPYHIRHDHGPSSLNYPYIWVSNFIYQAPLLSGTNALVRSALGGWEVSGIYTSQSGAPFTVSGGNGNNNSFFNEGQDRADVVPGVPTLIRIGGKSHWLHQYMNPAAYAQNAYGTPGNIQKYNIQSPYFQNLDAAVMKNFSFRERYKLQLRFEAYNALNHPSFGAPNANAGDPAFGQITSQGPEAPRQLQAAAKITF